MKNTKELKTPKRLYQCYDGTLTTSAKKMHKSWEDVYGHFAEVLDLQISGFDPTMSFIDKRSINPTTKTYSQSVQLPCWLVERVNEKLKELQIAKIEIGTLQNYLQKYHE